MYYLNYVDQNDFNCEKGYFSWIEAYNEIKQLEKLGCTRFLVHQEIED